MKRLVEFVGILKKIRGIPKIQWNSQKFIRIVYEGIWRDYGNFLLFIRKFE